MQVYSKRSKRSTYLVVYSAGQKKRYEYCFMKKSANFRQVYHNMKMQPNHWKFKASIHTAALSNEVYNFILAQETQKLSAIKFLNV